MQWPAVHSVTIFRRFRPVCDIEVTVLVNVVSCIVPMARMTI